MTEISNLYFEDLGMSINGIRRKAFNELNELVYTGKIKITSVTKCFCNDTDFEILSRFDRYGLPFGTQICRSCGLISQTISISGDSQSIFYDKIFWPLNMGTEDPIMYYTTSSSVVEFISFLNDHINSGKNCLSTGEVGCGIRLKAISKLLETKSDYKLFGCDYSEDALGFASAKGVKTFLGGMESLLNEAPFDILILSHIFEHFIDLKESLKVIDQLTHEKTLIYVEVPGVMELLNKPEYMYDYQDYTVLAHVHNFSLASLANVFKTNGFQLEKGTEYVRAIFRKNVPQPQLVNENAYEEIMFTLELLLQKHLNLKKSRNQPLKRYLKTLSKAVLGME